MTESLLLLYDQLCFTNLRHNAYFAWLRCLIWFVGWPYSIEIDSLQLVSVSCANIGVHQHIALGHHRAELFVVQTGIWSIPRLGLESPIRVRSRTIQYLAYTTIVERGMTTPFHMVWCIPRVLNKGIPQSPSRGIHQRHVVVYLELKGLPRFHFATWFGVYHDQRKGVYQGVWSIPRVLKRGIPRSPSQRVQVYPKDMCGIPRSTMRYTPYLFQRTEVYLYSTLKESRYTWYSKAKTSIPLRHMVWCIPRFLKRDIPSVVVNTTIVEKRYTKVAFSKIQGIPQRHVVVYLEDNEVYTLFFFKELRYTFILLFLRLHWRDSSIQRFCFWYTAIRLF